MYTIYRPNIYYTYIRRPYTLVLDTQISPSLIRIRVYFAFVCNICVYFAFVCNIYKYILICIHMLTLMSACEQLFSNNYCRCISHSDRFCYCQLSAILKKWSLAAVICFRLFSINDITRCLSSPLTFMEFRRRIELRAGVRFSLQAVNNERFAVENCFRHLLPTINSCLSMSEYFLTFNRWTFLKYS